LGDNLIFNLDEVIESWKAVYGTLTPSKAHGTEYYAIDKRERKGLFRYLVSAILAKDQSLEYLKQYSTQDRIAKSCFGPIVYDPKVRAGGIEAVKREFRDVLNEMFPDPDMINAKKNCEDMPSHVPATEEYNPAIHISPFKDLDRSLLVSIDSEDIVIDREAAKLLGFDDE